MMILTKRFCDPPNLSPIGFWRARSGFLRCKSIVFRGAKVWFLRCEKWVFVVRKYGVCDAKVWCFVGVRVYIAICL